MQIYSFGYSVHFGNQTDYHRVLIVLIAMQLLSLWLLLSLSSQSRKNVEVVVWIQVVSRRQSLSHATRSNYPQLPNSYQHRLLRLLDASSEQKIPFGRQLKLMTAYLKLCSSSLYCEHCTDFQWCLEACPVQGLSSLVSSSVPRLRELFVFFEILQTFICN